MNSSFSLPEASTHAVRVDHIFYGLLVLSGLTMLVVFGLVIVLAIRYRRGSSAKRGPLPEIVSREFEIGWTIGHTFPVRVFVLVGGVGRSLRPVGSRQRTRDACRRQTMDVEDPAFQWRPRDQRPACSRRPAGAAGDDFAGRHSLVLCSGFSRQAGRTAGTRHRNLVPGHQDRGVPAALRRILRHGPFHDAGPASW